MNALHHIASFWFALLFPVLLAPLSLAQALTNDTFVPEGIEATGDTVEVRALTEWAGEHRHTDPGKTRQVAERALVLARDIDDQRGIGQSLTVLGNLVFSSEPRRAETYYKAAHEVFEQIQDGQDLVHNQLNLGSVYGRRGDLKQALPYFLDALEEFERLGNTEGQVSALMKIGIIHQHQGNREEALVYYERALILAETLDEPELLVSLLNNFGLTFAELGSYEEAEIHLRHALAIAEDRGFRFPTAFTSNNLGFVLNLQGHYEGALSLLLRAERLGKDLGGEEFLGVVYDELAKAYMGLGQYDRALHYANESLVLMQATGGAPRQLIAIHETLSRIHEAAGNNEQALFYHRRYAALRDSVFTTEQTEIIAQLQARYETEEKQRANERLEQKNRIQALQLTLLLAGVGGLLLILGVLFYRYRLKQKANRLLEEIDAAKSRFFANISHEFRTPLTVILGSAQDALAGRFEGNKEKLTGQHRAILRNSRQLQRLVDEVLDLNRLEAGKLELQLASGDLVRLLRRLVEAGAPLAERNGIDLTFECDGESCPRLYDQEKLEKIVGNLLSNALKFTPKGGSVWITLCCGKETEITVADDGPGIPAEAQEKVFERFAQVKDGALQGGTGIGLALAKELTELHGGTITLESKTGEGSSFTVRLPLETISVDDLGTDNGAGASRVYDPAPGGGETPLPDVEEHFAVGGDGVDPTRQPVTEEGDRTTVLMIEDNDDVRAFIRRSLEETYRVLEAADGETGLQQARAELPDLIVSDIMLPGIDGYEVARRLKAEADTECIPVVMLTARAAEEDQTEGYGSGAEVYITKPFSPETLRAACARLLEERHRLRRRLQEEGNQTGKTERENGQPTLADHARVAVLENLHDENFGVEELASALHMTRFTLYHRFKAEVGVTPNTFVRALRMERARELLAGGAGSVSEVAYAVGFNSLSVFSRNYRKHYGAPPSTHLARSETR